MRALGFAALALMLAASAAAATPVKATLTTSTPTPVVDRPWSYTVVVRKDGKPIAARVRLQILLGQTLVGCWKKGAMAQCLDGSQGAWLAFRGKRRGTIAWPAESVGVQLTFQAIVRAGGVTSRLRAPVTVKAAG